MLINKEYVRWRGRCSGYLLYNEMVISPELEAWYLSSGTRILASALRIGRRNLIGKAPVGTGLGIIQVVAMGWALTPCHHISFRFRFSRLRGEAPVD